ncbi:MAG TPA: Xaa-Pro peptidase family protein [Azonexus sp.]|nr:Xaa-Pro peptidase family protein [Azonexus sp.]
MNHFKESPGITINCSNSKRRAMRVRRTCPVLFHADSTDPDMLYFSRFNAFDPYLAFCVGGRRFAVTTAAEFGRMVKESAFDEILLLDEVRAGAAKRFKLPKGEVPGLHQMVLHLAELHDIPNFKVGDRFPVGLARKLRQAGMTLEIANDSGLFPERLIKTAPELEALRKANRASEAGFRIVTKTLSESKIRNGKLVHGGSTLTAERLRALINHAALEAGAMALHTIAAPGDQAVDNHCVGHGPIRAGELIVVDIFPRRIEDGYWGDMTRTYLKGRASDAQRRLVRTVREAHKLAIDMIKPGVTGGKVHDAVQAFFDKEGYETARNSKQPKGFFHALGHGVGLEIHEEPIMRSKAPCKLRKGMVVTVEPGLYYEGLGGCRIEDMVHLVPGGCELISRAPYKWEFP